MAVDHVSFVSGGVYSETYDTTDRNNIASLFVSYGIVTVAPEAVEGVTGLGDGSKFIIFRELEFEPEERGVRCR